MDLFVSSLQRLPLLLEWVSPLRITLDSVISLKSSDLPSWYSSVTGGFCLLQTCPHCVYFLKLYQALQSPSRWLLFHWDLLPSSFFFSGLAVVDYWRCYTQCIKDSFCHSFRGQKSKTKILVLPASSENAGGLSRSGGGDVSGLLSASVDAW